MTCAQVQELLLDLAYGELDDARAAEAQAHLVTCAACRKELAQIAGVRTLMAPAMVAQQPRPAIDEVILRAARDEAKLLAVGTDQASSDQAPAGTRRPPGPRVVEVAGSVTAPQAVAPVDVYASVAPRAPEGPSKRRRWLVRAAISGSLAAVAGLVLVVGGTMRSLPTRTAESVAAEAAPRKSREIHYRVPGEVPAKDAAQAAPLPPAVERANLEARLAELKRTEKTPASFDQAQDGKGTAPGLAVAEGGGTGAGGLGVFNGRGAAAGDKSGAAADREPAGAAAAKNQPAAQVAAPPPPAPVAAAMPKPAAPAVPPPPPPPEAAKEVAAAEKPAPSKAALPAAPAAPAPRVAQAEPPAVFPIRREAPPAEAEAVAPGAAAPDRPPMTASASDDARPAKKSKSASAPPPHASALSPANESQRQQANAASDLQQNQAAGASMRAAVTAAPRSARLGAESAASGAQLEAQAKTARHAGRYGDAALLYQRAAAHYRRAMDSDAPVYPSSNQAPADSPPARSVTNQVGGADKGPAGTLSPAAASNAAALALAHAVECLAAEARLDEARRVYEQILTAYPLETAAQSTAARALRSFLPPPASRLQAPAEIKQPPDSPSTRPEDVPASAH